MPATRRRDFRLGAPQRFEPGDHVSQRAYFLLQLPLDQFDGPGIEAGAGHLREVAALRRAGGEVLHSRQVNACLAPLANSGPRRIQFEGDRQLAGEYIDRAERQHTQARALETVRRVADAVKHFIERAVAPGGDDDFKALADGFGGKPARIPGGGSHLERAFGSNGVQVTAEAPGFVAPGRWIKDDARPHAPLFGRSGADSRVERGFACGRVRRPNFSCIPALEVRAVLLYTLRQ